LTDNFGQVWRPALQTARHQGRLFQQLVILRSFDFARFVVAVNAPTSLPNSTEPAPPTGSLLPPAVAAPNASWLIRGPDTCWFTDCTQEARLCYSQFYAELCEELQCVALSLTQPSWAAQVTYRLDHQEWVRRQNAKNGTSDADAELDSNIDPEIAALSALTAAPITWCPISAGSATVLSVLPFFAFTAALNAVAATDHLPSLHVCWLSFFFFFFLFVIVIHHDFVAVGQRNPSPTWLLPSFSSSRHL
jgi:hypothetical protein